MNVCKAPKNKKEFQNYYQLRWKVLRKEWRQEPGSEQDELEDQSFHRMIVDENESVLAIGRLHQTDQHNGQIRYMAVAAGQRAKGLGNQIITELEIVASRLGLKQLALNARENAVSFYQRLDYQQLGFSHLLYDQIKHFSMTKAINCADDHQSELAQNLQATWHQTIPLSKAMNIELNYYNGQFLQTSCDLVFNKNLHNTMFAGSIYTLATLTGWAWVYMQLKHLQQQSLQLGSESVMFEGDIVLANANIRYKAPLQGTAHAYTNIEQVSGDLDGLASGKKSRFNIEVCVACGDKVVATFDGLYVVVPKKKLE
ncbi:MAG: YiiD C-terminal domain-containing protein [Alteromonadaceae bacterium]|nr:YiiD C-terminal domain-containing protein [Alteromonadaceae bacterium]